MIMFYLKKCFLRKARRKWINTSSRKRWKIWEIIEDKKKKGLKNKIWQRENQQYGFFSKHRIEDFFVMLCFDIDGSIAANISFKVIFNQVFWEGGGFQCTILFCILIGSRKSYFPFCQSKYSPTAFDFSFYVVEYISFQ